MKILIEYLRVNLKSWLQIFIATIGFVGSLVVFLPGVQLETTFSKLITLLLCFLLSLAVTFIVKPIRESVENLPLEELLFTEDCAAKVLFPYKEKYLKPLHAIAKTYYGKASASEKYLKTWYEKNPFILVTLADKNKQIVGYYDILPLYKSFAVKLIDGKVSEKDIRNVHILPKEEMAKAEYLYFAGVAIKNQHSQQSKIFAGYLLYSAYVYLKKYYDLSTDKKIFATAATKAGKQLLIHLNYSLECSKLNRKDKLDLYMKTVNKNNIEENMEKIIFFGTKVDFRELENPEIS